MAREAATREAATNVTREAAAREAAAVVTREAMARKAAAKEATDEWGECTTLVWF